MSRRPSNNECGGASKLKTCTLVAVALLASSGMVTPVTATQKNVVEDEMEWGRKTMVTQESSASSPKAEPVKAERTRTLRRNRLASDARQLDKNEREKAEDFDRYLMVEEHNWGGTGLHFPVKTTALQQISNMLDNDYFPSMSMSFSMSMPTPPPVTEPPSSTPTKAPTKEQTEAPTKEPTEAPTKDSSSSPTADPATTTSPAPSTSPTSSSAPTISSSSSPTLSVEPTANPSTAPSTVPTPLDCMDPEVRERLLMEEFVAISGEDAFDDPDSPQSQAANWMINDDPLNVNPCTFVGLGQRYGMAVFYYGLNGDDWIDNSGWLGGTSVCDGWFAVSCDASGVVTNILLPRNNLSGELQPEIKELTGLILLQLLENKVSGNVPTEIGMLSNLFGFDFESNQFEGQLFFDELFDLTNLQFLRASKNQFEGTVPWYNVAEFFPNLQEFWIADNLFEGNIGTRIGELQNLESFFAYDNNLSGLIPSEIGTISTLRLLDLENNFLSGDIPEEIYEISGLEQIILSNNMFFGSISTMVGQLAELTDFWCANCGLAGSLPVQITEASNLENLILDGNNFVGDLPSDFSNLQNANFINLSNNSFSGPIPPSLFSLPDLEILYIENNTLTGQLPTEIANAPKLRDLYLNGNELTGAIPEIPTGALSTLEELLLSFNDLSGSVPSSICALRNSSSLGGNLISLHVDCAIPPDPPEVECAPGCCTKCTRG